MIVVTNAQLERIKQLVNHPWAAMTVETVMVAISKLDGLTVDEYLANMKLQLDVLKALHEFNASLRDLPGQNFGKIVTAASGCMGVSLGTLTQLSPMPGVDYAEALHHATIHHFSHNFGHNIAVKPLPSPPKPPTHDGSYALN